MRPPSEQFDPDRPADTYACIACDAPVVWARCARSEDETTQLSMPYLKLNADPIEGFGEQGYVIVMRPEGYLLVCMTSYRLRRRTLHLCDGGG